MAEVRVDFFHKDGSFHSMAAVAWLGEGKEPQKEFIQTLNETFDFTETDPKPAFAVCLNPVGTTFPIMAVLSDDTPADESVGV